MVDITPNKGPALARWPRLVHDSDRPLAAAFELMKPEQPIPRAAGLGLAAPRTLAAAAARSRNISEWRQRRLGLAAVIALGVIGLCLTAQQHLASSHEDVTVLHTDGPFVATLAPDGAVRLGNTSAGFLPGTAFGWTSSFCTAPRGRLIMQARLVSMADNRVLLYNERNIDTDPQGCSSQTWQIALPLEIAAGRYQVQRFLLLTPPNGGPRTRTLPPLSVNILARP